MQVLQMKKKKNRKIESTSILLTKSKKNDDQVVG